MAKELDDGQREVFAWHGKTMAALARHLNAPLWQVREVLIAAFDVEAERVEP